MDEKELQEYKQKIKGLSLKELKDVLTHINKEKFAEKYQAIEAEIAQRTGGAPAKEVLAPEPPKEPPKEIPKEVPVEAKKEPPSEAPKSAPQGPAAPPAPGPTATTGPTIQLRKSKVAFTPGAQAPAPGPIAGQTQSTPVVAATQPPTAVPAPSPIAPITKPALAAAKPVHVPAKPVDMALLLVSAIFVLVGVYFLLIPFVNVPGSTALKNVLLHIPPHF